MLYFILYALIALIVYVIWSKIIKETIGWLQLRKQGVVFMPGFPPITDIMKYADMLSKDPTVDPIVDVQFKYISNPLPDYTALAILGTSYVFVNKAELLEEFYVKKNMYYSRAYTIKLFYPLLRYGPIVQRSDDPQYPPQKKTISAVFYKQKMAGIIEIIKFSTLEHVRKLRAQYKDGDIVSLPTIFAELLASIMLNACVGHGRAHDLIEFWTDKGIEEIPIYQAMIKITTHTVGRYVYLTNILFPFLTDTVMPWERDFKFNLNSVKSKLQSFIDERTSNPNANEEYDDILQHILKDEYFSKNHREVIDVLITLFHAGAKTTQVATVNMVYYLEMYPEHKKRFFDTIHPVCDKIKDFQKELTLDVVEEFDFIRNCFNESLRLEPSPHISIGSCFSKDVTIGGVTFKADQTCFAINITAINSDPRQWKDPSVYNPDRFDPNSEWFKRPDGGVRSPFAFKPFLGGKRTCMGISFTDMTQRFVMPILFSAFDFKFSDPASQAQSKPKYMLTTKEVPKLHMKLVHRREI